MTSRGSRFNPMSGGAPGKDSPEWIHTTTKNMRNFIRKWGTTPMLDAMMKPIVLPKYDIGLVVENCNTELLGALEPWCSTIYHDIRFAEVRNYLEQEQPHTEYNLNDKILSINTVSKSHCHGLFQYGILIV